MKKIRTAGICTLGCRVNQYESEVFAEHLKSHGVEMLDFSKPCDMYIINTCTVTSESDRKSRQMIRRVARTGAPIIVCGCHSQLEPEMISSIDGVSFICGNADKARLVKYAVDQILNGNIPTAPVILNKSLDGAEYENISIAGFKRTRAYIKIQDGCNGKCSYCIIPKARGLSRSRDPRDIVSEIKRIAQSGCNEIVLTGIETSDYSYGLGELISELEKVDGIDLIRFGSLDPSSLTKEFADILKASKKAAPHIHISLQSGCSKTLAAMRRKYNAETAYKNMQYLRSVIPNIKFTADMIVGFPGETEEDFAQSLEFAKKANFLHIHIFTYSKRPGTEAAEMPGQIPEKAKGERAKRLAAVCAETKNSILLSALAEGKALEMLAETVENGLAHGHTPDFIEIEAQSTNAKRGDRIKVMPLSTNGDILFAKQI